MSYEPLHHKYRPKSFAELVGQEAIATTLTNAISTSRIAPAYLFTGPRGTGKTSSARILAKSLNCLNSPQPTATPCGVCDVCQGITKGYSIDVIEIDAASNTGVDNIREIIERSQFAPVQCRYKVYAIDECLTGDSLVSTSEELVRIDDSKIIGKKVLSYNDSTGDWEYKKVVRWFDQGNRQTLVIKTINGEIRCTSNHLIRTDTGWIQAKDVKEGMRILSPANAVVEPSFTNMVWMDASGDLPEGTSSKVIPMDKKYTTLKKSWNKLNNFVPFVLADAEKSLISQNFCSKKAKGLAASNPTGKDTHTKKDTAFGSLEQNIFLPVPSTSHPQEVLKFSYIQKDIPQKKTRLLLLGLQEKDIPQQVNTIQGAKQAKLTTTSAWERIPAENGSQNSSNSLFPQWNTNLEKVESVHLGGVERVYDIEVEDNHNFVANGLLVHNCHMLSTQAFNALLKTLEEPPKHIVFVLATTDPQRVLPTIISRCQRFDFRRIPLESLVKHLTYISIQENISISEDAITLISQLSQGGLRDAESLLDQLSLLSGEVTPDKVWDLVGTVSEKDLFGLLSAIALDNGEAVIDSTRKILDRGREPLVVLQNLAGFYRDLLIAKTAPNRGDLVACTQETWLSLVQFSQKLSINNILVGQQHLRSAEVQLKNTTQPRLWLEVTILGLLPSAQQQPVIATNIAPVSNHSTNNYQPPVNQQPINQQPVNQPPVNQQPINQQPINQQPVNQPPINQQPVNQPPINQQPVNQPPINQQPVANNQQPVTNNQPLTNNQQDLTQVWQQVLSHLEPVSRRELLRQMCHVIELQEKTARLGIKQAWFKRVQADLPIITIAFRSAFQREIRVDLEVANSIHPKQASGDKSQQNGSTRQVTPPNSFAPTSNPAVPPTTPPTPQPIPESPPPANQAFQPNQQVTPNNESFVPNHIANNGNGNGNSYANNYTNTNGNGNNGNGNNYANNYANTNGNGSNGNGSNGNVTNGNGKNGLQNGSISEPETQAKIAPITPIEPIINDGIAEKLLHAAERLADFFDGKVIGFSEDDSEFGDFGTSPELMEIVDGDED